MKAVYSQVKTENGSGEFDTLAPDSRAILSLYTKENSKGDYKNNNESDCKALSNTKSSDMKIFPDTISKSKLSTHLKAVGLECGIRTPLTFHMARHSFGTPTLEAVIPRKASPR